MIAPRHSSFNRLFYKINRRESTAILTGLISVILALATKFSYYGIISVVIAFLVHEFAHRQTARRLGCSSRFVLDPLGLIITLLSSIFPIAFLAPGYMGINCWGLPMTRKGLLTVAGSGPLSNIILALFAFLPLILRGYIPFGYQTLQFLYTFAVINTWIAIFNLIPFGPLDGAKIFRADKKAWLGLTGVAVVLYIVLLFLF
jgi:Zn-dependent protease